MIQIGDVVVSFDVLREKFICNLDACKGACCVEGDAGAPVELDGIVEKVTGNTCKRGADYGKKEVTDPTRIVTSTVRVQGGTLPVVAVKTRGDIPKSSVMDCVLAESYVK